MSRIRLLGDDLDRVGRLFSGEAQPGERMPKLISPRRNGGHPTDGQRAFIEGYGRDVLPRLRKNAKARHNMAA